jgi:hypothetical protein
MGYVPLYISVVFILTVAATAALLFYPFGNLGHSSFVARWLLILLPVWLLIQALLALRGFYEDVSTVPPRLFLTGVLPALLFVLIAVFIFPAFFVAPFSLRNLTLIHLVRIPVELVLFGLATAGTIPKLMTFEGANFDILSGLIAIGVVFTAFRSGRENRSLLITFNVIGLVLLANIVIIAILALPSPIQQLAVERPNRAVLYFPFIWLPSFVVPAVLFSHLAAFRKLFAVETESSVSAKLDP